MGNDTRARGQGQRSTARRRAIEAQGFREDRRSNYIHEGTGETIPAHVVESDAFLVDLIRWAKDAGARAQRAQTAAILRGIIDVG
jgi:hypothetical protein